MLVPRTLIFITQGERVLLLKGAEDKRLWPGLYNGIGGHIEKGEDVLFAAKREILEETNLIATQLWLCGTITIDTQTNPGVCVFVFKGETKEDGLIPSQEGTLEWVKFSDVNHIPVVSDLRVLLPKILTMEYGHAPFSAHSFYNSEGKLVTMVD